MSGAGEGGHTRAIRRFRSVPWAGGFGAVLVVCLLSTPLSDAGPVSGVGTHYAPYNGAIAATTQSVDTGTCAPARITHPIHYDPHTAVTKLGLTANVTQCRALPRISGLAADVGSELYLQIPIRFHGVHRTISLNWTLSGNATTSVNPGGPCPRAAIPPKGYASEYCYLSSSVDVVVTAELLSAGGVILSYGQYAEPIIASSGWENQSTCTHTGNCTYYSYNSTTGANFSGPLSFETNITPTARELRQYPGPYLLIASIDAEVFSTLTSYPAILPYGASAGATLDLQGPTFGMRLQWIQVS